MKSEHGPPMTLGNAAAAGVRLIVWCGHQLEPGGCPVRRPDRVPDWHAWLVCGQCGSRRVDMVARVKCARSPLLPPLQWPASGVGKVR